MSDHINIFPIGAKGSPLHDVHFLPSEEAWAMCDGEHTADFRSVAFHAAAVSTLLAQPSAEALRIYKCHNGHHASFAIFAVDAEGNDLIGPGYLALENGTQCPPFCRKTDVSS